MIGYLCLAAAVSFLAWKVWQLELEINKFKDHTFLRSDGTLYWKDKPK